MFMYVCVCLFLFLPFCLPRVDGVRGVHFHSRREAETQSEKQLSQIICHPHLYLFMPRTVASLSPAAARQEAGLNVLFPGVWGLYAKPAPPGLIRLVF